MLAQRVEQGRARVDLQRAGLAIHAEADGWEKTSRLRLRQIGRLFQSDRRRDLGGDGCSADDHQIAAGDFEDLELFTDQSLGSFEWRDSFDGPGVIRQGRRTNSG